MNTQTHVLAGWIAARLIVKTPPCKGDSDGASLSGATDSSSGAGNHPMAAVWVAALIGGLLPDAWMIAMLLVEWIKGSPDHYVWNVAYFSPLWTQVGAIFNSIPLFLLLALMGWLIKKPWLLAFAIAAALHAVMDFPVHADDAHPHFWPLSDWKFISPFSYWESDKGAGVIFIAEMIFGVLGCAFLWRAIPQLPWRVVTGLIFAVYVLFGGMGVWFAIVGAPWDD